MPETPDIIILKPLPWLLKPQNIPAAVGTHTLKFIPTLPKNIPGGYQYQPYKGGAHLIPYREFVGPIKPPANVGYPGDIWIVDKKGSLALFACIASSTWEEWDGFHSTKEQLIPHPLLEDRYLSYSTAGFKWFALSTIRGQARRFRGHLPRAPESVNTVLLGTQSNGHHPRRPLKRQLVLESDSDERSNSDAEDWHEQESGKRAKHEFPETDIRVAKRSKAKSKLRRRDNRIQVLEQENDNITEEKTELEETNKDLLVGTKTLENWNKELVAHVDKLIGKDLLLQRNRHLERKNAQLMLNQGHHPAAEVGVRQDSDEGQILRPKFAAGVSRELGKPLEDLVEAVLDSYQGCGELVKRAELAEEELIRSKQSVTTSMQENTSLKQQLDESRSEAAKFRIGAEILARDNDELRQNEGKLRDDIRRLSGF